MNILDITAETLAATGTVALRKLARELGLKGMSSARGEQIREAIREAQLVAGAVVEEAEAARAEGVDVAEVLSDEGLEILAAAENKCEKCGEETFDAEDLASHVERVHAAPVVVEAAAPAPKKGECTECGRKLKDGEFGGLCAADRAYAEWENTHEDEGHADASMDPETDCPVCRPELDPRKVVKTSRSRKGMVIIAKGTEIHKSETFRVAAEAAGWECEVLGSVTEEIEEDGEILEIELYTAIARRGDDSIELCWEGRAYDYPNSGAVLDGKARKVRNLKEALRFLAR